MAAESSCRPMRAAVKGAIVLSLAERDRAGGEDAAEREGVIGLALP